MFDIENFKTVCTTLDIFVEDRKVATLSQEGRKFILNYLPGTSRDDFISLLMPVRKEPWIVEGGVHPFFQMSLPEGALGELILQKFGKALFSEQMALLGLVGSNTIGAVRAVPSGFSPDWRPLPAIDPDKLMSMPDANSYFAGILADHAGQGISGMMPKIMADVPAFARCTVKSDSWIYKHDHHTDAMSRSFEGVSLNEYLSLLAASRAGLPVSQCEMSADGHTMATKRFDRNGDKTLRFEDFCSLLGVTAREKYKGSLERLAKVTGLISSAAPVDKERLVRAHILNMILGNGDAHLKNFGVLYSGVKDVRLSPTFDVVTVRAFDHLYGDIPSLSLRDKKEWNLGPDFTNWAQSDCGVPPAKIKKIMSEVIGAVEETIPDIVAKASEHEWFREQAKKMVLIWHEGISMAMHRSMPPDDAILSQYKMSDVQIPESAELSPTA